MTKQSLYLHRKYIIFGIFSFFLLSFSVYATVTNLPWGGEEKETNGFAVQKGSSKEVNVGNTCKKVTAGVNVFVPTRTQAEWNAFRANAGNVGTNISDCASPPEYIFTDPNISYRVYSYDIGKYFYGYITGGDPTDTWGCVDVPGITECPYGNGNWRKLGTDTSDWYYYPSAGRFELRPGAFLPWDYPEGTYHTYARNGQYGKIGPASPITLTKPVPKTVYTDSNITYSVSSGNKGDTLYGYITGGNPTDTWGCIDTPSTNRCGKNGNGWRKLGQSPSWDWYYFPSAGRFELRAGLFIPWDYPVGTYYGYARNGQYGKIGPATPITLKIPKPTISDWSYISGNDVIGHQKIYNVAPNLLACTQPASLGNCTPDSYLNDGAHNEWVYNAKNSTYSLSLKFPGIASYAPFVSCVKNPGGQTRCLTYLK